MGDVDEVACGASSDVLPCSVREIVLEKVRTVQVQVLCRERERKREEKKQTKKPKR